MNHVLDLVIPAYNEADRILPTLENYAGALTGIDARILVIDDGSSDGTADVVRAADELPVPVEVHVCESNLGKGGACLKGFGMLRESCTHAMFADADGSTPAREFRTLLEASVDADVVIGSRALGTEHVRQHWLRRFMGQCFNRVFRILVPLDIRDTQCGFKLFSRRAAELVVRHASCRGFAFDVEWILIARANGLAVREVPVWWEHVEASRVHLIKDSYRMLGDLLRIRGRYRRGEYGP